MQPGDTITPGGQQPVPAMPQPPEQPVAAPEPVQPPVEVPSIPETQQQQQPTEIFNSQPVATTQPALQDMQSLSWTASEFIEHQKPHGWYLLLGTGSIIISAILYLFTRDVITVAVVVAAVIMFGIVGARKPRAMNYSIQPSGLQIGEKLFPFSGLKSFSVIEEGAINSIQLIPLKRFSLPISIYFPPEQEQQITDVLADYLPHEDKEHDAIDRLMKKLHF